LYWEIFSPNLSLLRSSLLKLQVRTIAVTTQTDVADLLNSVVFLWEGHMITSDVVQLEFQYFAETLGQYDSL